MSKPAKDKLDTENPLIFVVDDEWMICEMVGMILEPAGYRLQLFSNPREAAEAFVNAPAKPDLLLTDFRMEQMNGMELIEQCKKLCPGLRTILFSGQVDENFVRTHGYKPDLFLRKPFYPAALINLVEGILTREA
ncbi:MAG: response regulator [Verrucomicrobia bacterium]|nr:response regulator [Verrucomicrobiota bacterium]